MKNTANELIIIGTGPQAQIARDYFHEFSDKKVLGFACHEKYREKENVYGLPIFTIEALTESHSPDDCLAFVAVGYRKMNKMRQALYEEVKGLGFAFANFIHPKATVSESVHLGENVFVFEDNTIQPYVRIGNNTVLWSGNHIGHHSTIGDHCFISSHVVVSGSCRIGNNVFVGVNATFHDSLTISDECLIGAGALIAKSTKPKEVYLPSRTKPFPKDSEALGF